MPANARQKALPGIGPVSGIDEALADFLTANGYEKLCVLRGQICAVYDFIFTTGLVVNMGFESYERRYCFEHRKDALEALRVWDGSDHPGGPWIKCKGAGIDLLNPNWSRSPTVADPGSEPTACDRRRSRHSPRG